MGKITLSKPQTVNLEINEKSIVIVVTNNKKGYQTTHGFIGFGELFIETFNQVIEAIEDAENNDNTIGNSYALDCLQGVTIYEIMDYLRDRKISNKLKEKIKTNTKTLPFRVGIYKNKPTLYYIGSEDGLFLYDLLMIRQYDIKIRLCADCKRAFVPKTKDKYCVFCKQLSHRNRAKYENLKADPARLKYTRLQQRIKNRSNESPNYRFLFERLANNNKNLDWLNEWDSLDKQYQQVKKTLLIHKLTDIEWDGIIEKADISSIEDFAKWLDLQLNELHSNEKETTD